jgi:hypothetical protein
VITVSSGKLYWRRADGSAVRPFNDVANTGYPAAIPGTNWLLHNETKNAGTAQSATAYT